MNSSLLKELISTIIEDLLIDRETNKVIPGKPKGRKNTSKKKKKKRKTTREFSAAGGGALVGHMGGSSSGPKEDWH
jgi:hypothetical protein